MQRIMIREYILLSIADSGMCEKRAAAPHKAGEYNFSFSQFTINREVPAASDNVGAFLGQRRLAHFKINRKHRGKYLAARTDPHRFFTLSELSSRLRVQGDALSVHSSERSDQGGIIRRG